MARDRGAGEIVGAGVADVLVDAGGDGLRGYGIAAEYFNSEAVMTGLVPVIYVGVRGTDAREDAPSAPV
jgi:hypothetical protein